MKTSFFSGVSNLDELRKAYYRLAMENHPDRGGDEETMKAINAEYERLSKTLIANESDYSEGRRTFESQVSDAMREKIGQLITLHGLSIEVLGSWIWVTGNTYVNREKLNTFGFRFSRHKSAWYWHLGEYRKRNGNELSLEEIRNLYGREEITVPCESSRSIPQGKSLALP